MQDKSQYIFLSNGQRGGVATFINDHVNYLSKKGKKISLIDDNPKKTYENLKKKITLYRVVQNKKKINKILNTGRGKKILFITNYAFLIKYFFILKDFRKNDNQIILTLHSGLLSMNIKSYVAGFFFSLLYRNVDFLFFGSNSAKNWWKRKYPWMKIKNAPIFYNGVEIKKKRKVNKARKRINISFAARLEHENNPSLFLDIASKFLKAKRKVSFNIYGDGQLLSELKQQYVNKDINFYGWVNKEEIYKQTDILLITGPVNNYPYAALEAKSYGIPVISCSEGDIDKIIENGKDGFIKKTNKPEIMIKLINKILNNYDFFSDNSYLRSLEFDINKSCEKIWRKIEIENYNFR
tara:strand:- start:3806 stop:4861 length:1056 start_codon:yes stop_codon:yes gene_type:complete